MQGLNVVTYQASKKNQCAAGSNQDILNRLDKLENQQTNIYNEFFCDFKNASYIDEYKTNVLFTSEGIIPRQYKENTFINFSENDDNIDYDNSTNVAWINKSSVQFDTDITTDGELYLFPIKVNNAVGFKLDSDYTLPSRISGTLETVLNTGNQWTAHEVDKFGRLWVFTKSGYTNEKTDKIHLTIYNEDMTIYDEKDIDNFLFIASGYIPMSESTIIKFNDNNICFMSLAEKNITHYRYVSYLNIAYDYQSNVGIIIDRYDTDWDNYGELLYSYHPYGNIKISSDIIFFNHYGPCGNNESFFCYDLIIKFTSINDFKIIHIVKSKNNNYGYNVYLFKSHILRINNKFYYLRKQWNVSYYNADYIPFSNTSVFEFTINDDKTKVAKKELAISIDKDVYCATASYMSASDVFFYNGYMYNFYSNSTKNFVVRKYKYEITDTQFKLTTVLERTYTLATSAGMNVANKIYNRPYEFIENGIINFFYDTRKGDSDDTACTKYMAFDLDLNLVTPETILYETTSNKLLFDVVHFDNGTYLIEDYNKDNNYTSDDTNNKCMLVKTKKVISTLQYYYYDDVKRTWKNINAGDEVVFNYDTPVNEITIKAVLESQTYNASPIIKSIDVQSWNNNEDKFRQSEYYSSRINTVQNDGKGILTADYEDNDGTIDWYVSFDGGLNYTHTNLNEEFIYTHIKAPDFRVKAVLSVTDNAKTLPIVHSYTLKTSHVVLHSDLEEVQINLMKTNFKIDTYTKASKNGLMKMTIDTLSDDKFIDTNNSDYAYSQSYGYACGKYIQTKPEVVDCKVTTLLLTVDETLDENNKNCKILYYASTDGGTTFKQIVPNVKTQIINTNSGVSSIVLKAVFYENAKLSAWGWAWN